MSSRGVVTNLANMKMNSLSGNLSRNRSSYGSTASRLGSLGSVGSSFDKLNMSTLGGNYMNPYAGYSTPGLPSLPYIPKMTPFPAQGRNFNTFIDLALSQRRW